MFKLDVHIAIHPKVVFLYRFHTDTSIGCGGWPTAPTTNTDEPKTG